MFGPDSQPPGEAPVLSENAVAVLRRRYLRRNEKGECTETPAQLLNRVACAAAEAETRYGAAPLEIKGWHKRFYDLLASLKFLPNSPALMNAGRDKGMLSACFVLPIGDSIEEIFETVKDTAIIQKAGGGTGFSFDRLRPTGDRIASSGGTTSGPMSFWKVFCDTTESIQQGAFRRGANMGMMSVDHPDILKFINAKQNLHAFTNFNISVKITDQWMRKLVDSPDSLHIATNPRTRQKYLLPRKLDIATYTITDLVDLTDEREPAGHASRKFYTVGDIWKQIVSCAHKTGEPGAVFIDRINRDNPTPSLGQIEATNPCGEQPLLAYEACTLGSINLTKFVIESDRQGAMDWPALAQTTKLAVRFLDNIVDACSYPVRQTVRLAQGNRKIGLGVMGFADCLFMLGIPYDSTQAVEFGERVMGFVEKEAHHASSELADLRGPFPNWSESTWRTEKNRKIRNACVTCLAPTGTISIIGDCSCSIEPVYSLVFVRQGPEGSKTLEINPIFRKLAEEGGFYSEKLAKEIGETGSVQKIGQVPARVRKIFKCAFDIKPEWHIRIQAAFQRHCDAAVSKTLNFGEKATVGAVDKGFRLAYQLGCKGVTAYRRRSREGEPMGLG